MEPKTGTDVSKYVVLNVWTRPPFMEISVVYTPWVQRRLREQAAGELITEMRMRTCNCPI